MPPLRNRDALDAAHGPAVRAHRHQRPPLRARYVRRRSDPRGGRAQLAGMSNVEVAVEVVGWAGAALILLAYLLLSAGRLTGQSIVYQGMNIVGAAGFIVDGWWHGALPSTALNVIWMGIGGVALWRIWARQK